MNIKISIIIAVVLGGVLAGCSDINSRQQPFLDQSGRIYVGKIDSLRNRGGLERVQLLGHGQYLRTATMCEVTWEEEEPRSKRFEIEGVVGLDGQVQIDIDEIPEGTYVFSVRTFDAEGNSSIIERTESFIYGPNHIATLVARKVSKMETAVEGITLYWNRVDNAVASSMTYESNSGEKTIDIDPEDLETIIADWTIGGEFSTTTTVLPQPNSLDLVTLMPVVQHFPSEVYFSLDKSLIGIVDLPTDCAGDGWGWGGSRYLFDNNTGTGYHTPQNGGVPNHFTVDLGVVADINQFEVIGRDNWYPKRIQLWGIDELNAVNYTTLASMDDGWEDEALEKGWKLLGEFDAPTKNANLWKVDTDKVQPVRYLRFRTVEAFEGTGVESYTWITEINLWGSAISPLP